MSNVATRNPAKQKLAAGELVLWPYAYTYRDLPPDMTALDLSAFKAMGKAMVRLLPKEQ